MSTAIDTMKNFFNIQKHYSNDANADGIAVLDDAVRSVTHFANLQHAIDNFVADTTNTEIYPDTEQRLQATSGIVLGWYDDFTADTGAISGKNAGGATLKNAATIVPETSDLTNLSLPTEGSTTTHTYTGADGQTFTFYIKWPESFTKFYDLSNVDDYYAWMKMSASKRESYYRELTSTETFDRNDDEDTVSGEQIISGMNTIIKGMYNFWFSEAAKLAYDSYGVDFNGKTVRVQFAGGGWFSQAEADTEWGYENFNEYTLPTDEITMIINAVDFAVIDPDDPNGDTHIEGGKDTTYLDRVIAHEMIHGVMFGQGLLKYTSPEFFTEGIADLVQGSDDYDGGRTARIRRLAESNDSLSSAMSLEPGTGTPNRYVSGYMFLRYLAHQSLNTNLQIGNNSSSVAFGYDGGEDILLNYKTSDTVNYSTDYTGLEISGDDLILNSSTGKLYIRDARNSLINISSANENMPNYFYMAGGAGEIGGYDKNSVLIGANDAENIITAGSGNSSLWGGNGNISDTMNGGTGADIFFYGYGNGNDVIGNATANDSVNLFNVTMDQISSAEITDSGVNLTFSDGGSLTVDGQAGSFVLSSSGQTYHADYQNKIWTT